MPSPPKTTDDEIVAAARKLLEAHGPSGFSMGDVAAAVGVRAPSLYGRFSDRSALLAAVELKLLASLERSLTRATRSKDPIEALTELSHAYRAFANAHPRAYGLLYDAESARTPDALDARISALAVATKHLVPLVGEEQTLQAARVLVPFLHGFVSMEIAGAFRMGGELDDAFAYGVRFILEQMRLVGRPARRTLRKR